MPTLSDFTNSGPQEGRFEENIQAWLVEQIGQIMDLLPEQIDITVPFASYGLDSVAAAGLSGELSAWLGVQLPPTITWDYPSVKLLASYLASTLAEQCLAAV